MNSATNSSGPRFSIVIVTYNSRENIRVCLDSLRRCGNGVHGAHAGDSQEIIVVDNASRDGTQDYLSAQSDIRAILNPGNNGFSKGCNQGAAIATGEYLIFLNPDTLATPGWAGIMARHFRDPAVGAVGPVSNYVAGLQRLDMNLPPAWRDAKSFPGNGAVEVSDNMARILFEGNAGKGVETKLLIGFCLMMGRSLYAAMGGMDENLFLGNDDLDLSWRLRNLGRKLVVASDAFIFHEGQKSFQTEAKSHVDRLTQESTDALYIKLVDHYGGREKLPSALDLWGISWFSPSPSLLQGPLPALPRRASVPAIPPETEASMKNEAREHSAWKSLTVAVYQGADAGDLTADRLDRTLASLPGRPGAVILILNCAGSTTAPEAPEGASLRKLDLGKGFPPRQALEIALALVPQSHILFCLAGTEFSALFNHWLDKRDPDTLGPSLPLPLRIGGADSGAGNTTGPACAAHAFLCRKEWLREALTAMPAGPDAAEFLASLGGRLERDAQASRASGKPADPPWLLAHADCLPRAKAAEPGKPAAAAAAKPGYNLLESLNKLGRAEAAKAAAPAEANPNGDHTDLYPASLRTAMRESLNIGFAGTAAETPPRKGHFNAYDPKGELVPIAGRDLVILRVTPDLLDGLAERMANIRAQAPGLKRLIAVFNGEDALRKPPEGNLPALDLTPEGVRLALWRSGFAVTDEKPYRGFPEGAVQGSTGLQGWTQLEALPRSQAHSPGKKVSIIILGFNQVAYTRKCIESIRAYTRQDYELILIDNGSKDGTEAFFRSIPGAKVVRNSENLGVAKGWNQGMRLADGEYLLILNNDIIVGPDWLENMVRLAESDASIGMVGPRSNYIAGPQIVPDVPYKAEEEIQGFIRKWQEGHALSAAEFGFIKGFCHLIPRRVFEKVGFYDERFGKGNFEDDDYCVRVRCHGFRTLMADDSFIHHYGSVSFNQESVDWQALMIENRRKYEDKWAKGASAVNDTLVEDPVKPSAPEPSRTSAGKAEQGRIAFESGDMPRARTLFLEAQAENPADPEPYCSLGVMKFSEGDASAAIAFFLESLNRDSSHADAAANLLEAIAAESGEVSAETLSALRSRYRANAVFDRAQPKAEGPGWIAVPEVAEATLAAIGTQAPLPTWKAEVEELIGSARYAPAMDILEKRILRGDDAAASRNYLGIIAHACGDAALALDHFRAASALAPSEADIAFNLADTLIALGRGEEAARGLEAFRPGAGSGDSGPDTAAFAEQIRHALAKGAMDGENLLASRDANQEAETLLREAGSLEEAGAFLEAAVDVDGEDFRALNNLGLVSWRLGDVEAAWKFFTRSLAVRPAWSDALINAFEAALALDRLDGFAPWLDKALAAAPGQAQALAIRGHILAQGPAACSYGTLEALDAGAEFLREAERAMEKGRKGEAILIYLDAVARQARNPQAFNGLGIIAFGEKRYSDAFGLFDAAAAMHPLDQDILMNLWQSAQALRREGEVLPKLRHSLERNPALEEVKAVVNEYA